MKTSILVIFGILLCTACQNDTKPVEPQMAANYIQTKKVDTVDTYFGTEVPDPYRWLEDDRSPETEAWVKEQNEVTFGYLEKIPFRQQLKERLEKLWNYEKIGAPFKEGDYTYFVKNDGLQNQSVWYRYKTDTDPFSKNGKILAYSISEGGSDWRKILVLDAETKKITEDTLIDIKFSGMSWYKNEGFYYSSYDKPEGSELSAKTDQHKVYYHKLGTKQSEDQLIFGGTPEEKHRYIGAGVSEDDHYLIISASVSTSGNKLFIKDLTNDNAPLITILDDTDSDTNIIDNVGSTLYLSTAK